MLKRVWLKIKSCFSLNQEDEIVEKSIKKTDETPEEYNGMASKTDKIDYDGMTKKELMDIARRFNLKGRSTMNKAELLHFIRLLRR